MTHDTREKCKLILKKCYGMGFQHISKDGENLQSAKTDRPTNKNRFNHESKGISANCNQQFLSNASITAAQRQPFNSSAEHIEQSCSLPFQSKRQKPTYIKEVEFDVSPTLLPNNSSLASLLDIFEDRRALQETNLNIQNNNQQSNVQGQSIQDFIKNQKQFNKQTDIQSKKLCNPVEYQKNKSSIFRPKISLYNTNSADKENTRRRLFKRAKPLELVGEKLPNKVEEIHYRTIILDGQNHNRLKKQSNGSTGKLRQHIAWKKESQDTIVDSTSNRNALITNRLVKEICRVCCRSGIKTSVVSKAQFGLIMTEMQLLSGSTVSIVEEIWKYISSDEQTSIRNALFVVCWVFGVNDKSFIEKILSESNHIILRESEGERSTFKSIQYPDEKNISQLKGKLEKLYLNRLHSDCLKHSEREFLRSKSERELTFQPEISQKTRILAIRQRTKVREVQKSLSHRHSCAIIHSQSINDICNTDRPAFRRSGTFFREDSRPALEQNYSTHRYHQSAVEYDCKPVQKRLRKSSQKKLEVEFSFKPNLFRPRVDQWKPKTGNVQKEIVRMIQARKLRDVSNTNVIGTVRKGSHPMYCEKTYKKSCEPVVRLDIYIDQSQKHQLVFYEEDQPSDVARRFSNKFEVSSEVRSRLSELILSEYQKGQQDQQRFM